MAGGLVGKGVRTHTMFVNDDIIMGVGHSTPKTMTIVKSKVTNHGSP